VNANDATFTGPTSARTGSTVAAGAGAPVNPGLRLIRHRVRSVPAPTVTGLAGQALTLGRGHSPAPAQWSRSQARAIRGR